MPAALPYEVSGWIAYDGKRIYYIGTVKTNVEACAGNVATPVLSTSVNVLADHVKRIQARGNDVVFLDGFDSFKRA